MFIVLIIVYLKMAAQSEVTWRGNVVCNGVRPADGEHRVACAVPSGGFQPSHLVPAAGKGL